MGKRLLFAAMAAVTAVVSFTSCSVDDKVNAGGVYTDTFMVKYSDEDSVDLATVREAYAKAMNSTGEDNLDSIIISGKDSAECATKFLEMMKIAEDALNGKTFSSQPVVMAGNKSGSIVYNVLYGEEDNGATIKSIIDNGTIGSYYEDRIISQYAGDIWNRLPEEYEPLYYAESPDFSLGIPCDDNHVWVLAAKNKKSDKYLGFGYSEITYDPITDVVIWDRTTSIDKDVKEQIKYNGRTYYLVDNNLNCELGKSYKPHELCLYFTRDKGTGKRMLVDGMFTCYKQSVERKYLIFTLTNYYDSTVDDFKNMKAVKNVLDRNTNYHAEFVPRIATFGSTVMKISDASDINENDKVNTYVHFGVCYEYNSEF